MIIIFTLKKKAWQNECLLCLPVSNGLFVDTIRKCAFCFPAPVAVLQIKSPNVLLNKMRSPNEIVPAITRKSIENIQQLLSPSSFTLIGLFCPSPYAPSEKAPVPRRCTAEPGAFQTALLELLLKYLIRISNESCSTAEYLWLVQVC